jgi:iron(III) transport system permease protein
VPSVFAFGKPLIGTFIILPIAYAIAALPLLLNAGRIALGGVSAGTEEASRSLGAGPAGTFARIVLPAVTPGVLSGAILVFVRTMGEYTMSALLYGVYNRPISVSVVTNMQEYHVGVSMAYGALIVVLCCGLMWAVLKLDRSRFAVE